MTQLSRPYQIALLAMVLFVAVWFLALGGHKTTPEASTSSPAVTPASPAATSAAPPVNAGAAVPGTAAHTPATHRAASRHSSTHKAAGSSAHKAAGASTHKAAGASTHTPARASAHPAKRAGAPASSRSAHAKPLAPIHSRSQAAGSISRQASVEGQLKQGKIVAILFWNPQGAVDQTVSSELGAVERTFRGGLAIDRSGADGVGAFGTITRDVQVDQTPTILLISKTGSTQVLTGLTDAYAIEQALEELKG